MQGLLLVLPRGGRLHGRLLSPGGNAWDGFRVGIEAKLPELPQDAAALLQRMEITRDAIKAVGVDGYFELGPVPAGLATVYLYLPEQGFVRTDRIVPDSKMNRLELGAVTIEEDVLLERDFEVHEFPGAVAIRLLVNGEAVAGIEVGLSMTASEKHYSVHGHTDGRGYFGPVAAFPGKWILQAVDPDSGWHYSHSLPVFVSAGEESRAEINVQVIEASVRFLDGESGAPLANRSISLIGWAGARIRSYAVWASRETDSEGRATWTLAPGEYRFRLDASGPDKRFLLPGEWRTADMAWTLAGAVSDEVRL